MEKAMRTSTLSLLSLVREAEPFVTRLLDLDAGRAVVHGDVFEERAFVLTHWGASAVGC